MTYLKQKYERLGERLETSEQILYAIEKVTGEKFRYGFLMDSDTLIENAAYKLWEEGGREQEIFEALPLNDSEEQEAIFWNGEFAWFDGEQWIRF